MLKALNVAVNDVCNHKCVMCNIWKNKKAPTFTPSRILAALSRNPVLFSEVIDLSLTGGEPFLRQDIYDFAEAILVNLPKLEIFFINTNGTLPARVKEFAEKITHKVPLGYICVSLDGDEDLFRDIRGVDGYKKAIETINVIKSLNLPNVVPMLSTTLIDGSTSRKTLEHVLGLSKELDCEFTFRIAETSETYYKNNDFRIGAFNDDHLEYIEMFAAEHKPNDRFLPHLLRYKKTNTNPVMITEAGVNRCKAGSTFVFVESNGNVRPCIYSKRIIGNIEQISQLAPIKDLGSYEPCPCCTECTVYPMLISDDRS